jgi:hypothetical protein
VKNILKPFFEQLIEGENSCAYLQQDNERAHIAKYSVKTLQIEFNEQITMVVNSSPCTKTRFLPHRISEAEVYRNTPDYLYGLKV